MEPDKDHQRKRNLEIFVRDQSYKDRLLKLQSKKLIDDLRNADEVKNIQSILTVNQRKLEKLTENNNINNSDELVKELSYQLIDMQNQLTVHKRKLIAYQNAAKKFKGYLDNAENRKKDFLEGVGMYEECISTQTVIKLTSSHKVSEETIRELAKLNDKQKNKHQLSNKKVESDTITVEANISLEPNNVTLFSEDGGYGDLGLIRGLGLNFQTLLHNEGVNSCEQIANWTEEEVKKRDKRLVFRGRIEREKWVEQAKVLVNGNEQY